jgi:hypothetical protein
MDDIPEEVRSHLHPGESLKLKFSGLEGILFTVLGF